MTPATLCTSHLMGLCQLREDTACYAKREEIVWKNTCVPSRLQMRAYWDSNSAMQIAVDLSNVNETKRNKITLLRLNECGDLRHQPDLDKAETLASYLSSHADPIGVYLYTARSDLDFSIVDKLVVNCSGWSMPSANRFQIAYDLETFGTKWTCHDRKGGVVSVDSLCPGDCRVCSLCSVNHGKTIGVEPH